MAKDIRSYRSLDSIRDRVLELCGNHSATRALDAGCGNGLVGRALLERFDPDSSMTFLDSDPASLHELEVAFERDPRVTTIVDNVESMQHVESNSIDLLMMRAVLLYVEDKHSAIQAANRVLAPEGRLVIAEPINRHLYHPADRLWGFDLSQIPAIAAKLQRGYTDSPEPAVRSMMEWDDNALATSVANNGFVNVRMETTTEITAGPPIQWQVFVRARWTPILPSLAQVMPTQP